MVGLGTKVGAGSLPSEVAIVDKGEAVEEGRTATDVEVGAEEAEGELDAVLELGPELPFPVPVPNEAIAGPGNTYVNPGLYTYKQP